MSEKNLESILGELDSCKCPYCFFKTYFEEVKPDVRFIIQVKCVEIYKWEIGEKIHKDVGFSDAFMRWVEYGYAKIFAEKYKDYVDSPAMTIKELYENIKKEKEKKN